MLKVKITSRFHGRLWSQHNPCWVRWVLTFGYRNWIIILGVTPPVGFSSSHYGALLIGLAEVTCLSASCHAIHSKEVSPCVNHLLHVLTYHVGLPIYVKVLYGLSDLPLLLTCFVSNDEGCLNAFLSTSLLLSTPTLYLREWLRNPFEYLRVYNHHWQASSLQAMGIHHWPSFVRCS